jgi:uncharacterized SAM-dependent methyltransferase
MGTDLVTPVPTLIAAYDDDATAALNLNVLEVVPEVCNRAGCDSDRSGLAHTALWNAAGEHIGMRLRFRRKQVVTDPRLRLRVAFAEGVDLLTEISCTFSEPGLPIPASGSR